MPIQQMLLGAGASVATKPYIDDVFSTFLYKGNSGTQSINNGINQSGEGSLTWIKARNDTTSYFLYDTERGAGKQLNSDSTADEHTDTSRFSSFNNNGFSLGNNAYTNDSSYNYSSWTFRKAPGFFDVVTYTGNGTDRTIAHSLGCVPGFIIVKRRSAADQWECYHVSLGASKRIRLEGHGDAITNSSNEIWLDTKPTSTHFTIGAGNYGLNGDGETYVAYLFAGGESTAATAVSVDFDGDDHLDVASSSDLDLGTGDFTIEFWAKFDGTNTYLECCFDGRHPSNVNNGLMVARWHTSGHENKVSVYMGGFLCEEKGASLNGQWNHFAVVRASGTTSLYKNGKFEDSFSDSNDWSNDTWNIACLGNDESGHANAMRGWISNFRVVKGTAVYTGAFRTPTAPLTAITNTKLLCCQSSTVTASTGVTLSANGNPAASTDSPFDDPAGFVFGENEDQGIVKCGNYTGNGSGAGTNEIDLGWEPQWLLIKRTSDTASWRIYDTMRGIVTGGDDARLLADLPNVESSSGTNEIDLTPTGFKLVSYSAGINGDGDNYVYMAIRRPDGYVGKPAEAGTDVFAMDTGAGSSTIPNFDSGFPVDFAFYKSTSGTGDWITGSRLTSGKYLHTNTTDTESSSAVMSYDSNVGWNEDSAGSGYQSWMWKRHAGMDCISYKGDGVAGKQILHSLSKTPEMIWIKNSDRSEPWRVYHKGLNGGTTPHNYGLKLNTYDPESAVTIWNQTAPTSTHFTINADSGVNHDGEDMRAFLFASVSGISSIGSYAGSDTSNVTVNCGFQPRFILIKENTATRQWVLFDTVRGIQSPGVDQQLYLSADYVQDDDQDYLDISSTGFTVKTNSTNVNQGSQRYIYYAHA